MPPTVKAFGSRPTADSGNSIAAAPPPTHHPPTLPRSRIPVLVVRVLPLPPMIIRDTTPADFAAIAALTNQFILNTTVHFAYHPMTPADFDRAWRESSDRFPWFTVECDGRFAGYAKAGPWRTREAYQWTAEVGIYIEADFRGRGVGAALYTRLLDDLRARGFHSAIGGVTLPNPASVRLHERLGFQPVGVVRQAGHKFGQWLDVGFWQLLLRDGDHQPVPFAS